MALVKGADTHHMAETISAVDQNGFRWGCNGLVFIGVDLDQTDKMAPPRVKSELQGLQSSVNQHFWAETDLLDLECLHEK